MRQHLRGARQKGIGEHRARRDRRPAWPRAGDVAFGVGLGSSEVGLASTLRARGPGNRSIAGDRFRAILIAGPTASGKSALAIALAQQLGGAVVNADSMQVYRDLRIITARPSAEEEAQAPAPALRPCRRGGEPSRSAAGCEMPRERPGRRRSGGAPADRDRRHGALFPRADRGPVEHPAGARRRPRGGARGHRGRAGRDAASPTWRARDPATAATLRPTDRQRILRALEVFEATGRPLVSFHGEREGGVLEPRGVPARVPLARAGGGLLDASTRASTP